MEIFDAIILGGGKAGKTLAMDLAHSGKNIAMVEQNKIGGTCINVGCIPTKTLRANANFYKHLQMAQHFSVELSNMPLNFANVIERKDKIIQSMREANHKAFLNSGMTFVLGKGAFIDNKTIEVQMNDGSPNRQLKADNIFINTGAKPFVPPVPGLEEVDYLTNETLLNLKQLPKKMLVLGGGYIGLEFSQMFRHFGCDVDVIEMNETFVGLEDRDIAEHLHQILIREGIGLHLGARATKVKKENNTFSVTAETVAGGKTFTGDALLVAVGRSPVTADLNLATTGVEVDPRGFIIVNEFLETAQAGIFALGDVKGGPQFTHLSLDDYRIVKHNLNHPTDKHDTNNRQIPYTVFLEPELARYGLTEQQAISKNLPHHVYKLPFAAIPRAQTLSKSEGVIKAVVCQDTDLVLGVSVLGENAGEIMGALQLAMLGNLTATQIRDTMYAHPTIVESFNMLFSDVFKIK